MMTGTLRSAGARAETVPLQRLDAPVTDSPPEEPHRAGSPAPSVQASPAPVTMPPLPIVQRQAVPHEQHTQAAPTPSGQRPGVSFAAMFAGAGTDGSGGGGAGADGFTTVQLQAADGAPAAQLPSVPTPTDGADAELDLQRAVSPQAGPAAGSGPSAAPAPGAAPAGADLDEMARRLFEPLSARLRAELWLDRERAGLVGDARP